MLSATMDFKDLVHYSQELENAVLGICMFEPSAVSEVLAMLKIPEVFYFDENRMIFSAIKELKTGSDTPRAVDAFTIAIECARQQPHPNKDRWQYVCAKKMQDVVTSAHLNEWCLYLIQFYMKREQMLFQTNLSNYHDPLEASAALNETLKKAMIFKNTNDWNDVSQLMLELQKRREAIRSGVVFGVRTGIAQFDELAGGFQTGFHVICARPGMGKTAVALSFALNIVERGEPVGFISLEMPNVQLASRFLAQYSGIDFRTIFNGPAKGSQYYNENTEADIDRAISDASVLPLYTTDKAGVNLRDISAKAEKLVRNHGAKIIFIDYLQLVEVETERNIQRYVAVGNLSRGLKLLSTQLDIPVIALAQVNRESEGSDKASKPAKLSQLRESGSIEQDVDMGIVIDRPWKRGVLQDETGISTEDVAFIDVQKHRNGPEDTIQVKFDKRTMRFKDQFRQISNNEIF